MSSAQAPQEGSEIFGDLFPLLKQVLANRHKYNKKEVSERFYLLVLSNVSRGSTWVQSR